MALILLINGPNLNNLGNRAPELYGSTTLPDVESAVAERASELGHEVRAYQSNHEGAIVDFIQEHGPAADGVIINAAAYTHTSVAIHDALKLLSCPIVEVHLSDPHTREEFRHKSFIEPLAAHIFKGLGKDSYIAAIKALAA